jgi:hypothetical protein
MSNNCSPANIFGPFEHTLFMGLSVMGFTASVGWNEQVSELTITLVRDTCAGSKFYYDESLNRISTTEIDPGLRNCNVGSPCYFRAGNFEWTGLLQSYQEINSEQGVTYSVKLVGPNQILEGCQLIVGDYAGSVYDEYNLFSVMGYLETFGGVCPETVINGATFGSPAGGFGGSQTNEFGMPVNRIALGTSLLTSSIPFVANKFSPYGRIIFKGANPSTHSYGNIEADFFDPRITINFANHDGYLSEYYLDLSELPTVPDYYRFSATNISIMDFISTVCSDAGSDFYLELIPVKFGGSVVKFIKLRTVSRAAQPLLGQISSFIGNSVGTENTSVGVELRNENTASFLIGGNKQTLFQIDQDEGGEGLEDDIIAPFFGVTQDNSVVPALKDDDGSIKINVNIEALNQTLHTPLAALSVHLTENEMRCALAGPDDWLSYAVGIGTHLGALLPIKGVWDPRHFINVFNNLAAGKLLPHDVPGLIDADRKKEDLIAKDIDAIFNFVLGFARDYYGKKYTVRLPYSCVSIDQETGKPIMTDLPSEGGWTEISTILELPHPSALTDLFSLEDGRVAPIFKFDTAERFDVSNLDVHDWGIINNKLYVKATIDPELYWLNGTTFVGPRVVMTLPQAVGIRPEDADIKKVGAGLDLMLKKLANIGGDAVRDKLEAIGKKVGNQELNMGAEYKAAVPDSAAVPLRSTISTYGPWYISGPPGQTRIEKNDSLVPWEYGSTTTMNTAASAIVAADITYQQVGEMGSVTVPGYPTIPLGAELGAIDGGFFGGGIHLIETRDITTNDFSEEGNDIVYGSVGFGGWTGLYGPNVTGVSVSIGSDGAKTTYQMRTFTPKVGKFARQNAERIKKIGRLNYNQQRRFRGALLKQLKGGFAQARLAAADVRGAAMKNPAAMERHSPGEILVGQQAEWTGTNRRQNVTLSNFLELPAEFGDDYRYKAMMSLDGLVTPVSMDGDGNLPPYCVPVGSQCIPHQSVQPSAPVDQWVPATIAQPYLNPLTNPAGFSRSTANGTHIGHDVEVLARGTSPPPSSMVIPIDQYGGNDGYANDYRFVAMKGPIMLQAWGYDLEGKPVPNFADTEVATSGGVFATTSLWDTFFPDWLTKRHTWPVAPIDLRLDRTRGVWTIPQPFRFQHATLTSCLTSLGTATAVINAGPTIYGSSGTAIPPGSQTITITDRNGICLPNGTMVTVYYDTYDCEYHLLDWPMTVQESGNCPPNDNGVGAVLCLSRLVLGSGIIGQNLGCGTIAIHSDLRVDGQDHVSCIDFDVDNFTTTKNGCCRDIKLKEQGDPATIEYVCNVECTGGTLTVYTATLTINEYGIVTASGACQ